MNFFFFLESIFASGGLHFFWEIVNKHHFKNKLLSVLHFLSRVHFCNAIRIASSWFNITVKESPKLNINIVNSPPISYSGFCQLEVALLSSKMRVAE